MSLQFLVILINMHMVAKVALLLCSMTRDFVNTHSLQLSTGMVASTQLQELPAVARGATPLEIGQVCSHMEEVGK